MIIKLIYNNSPTNKVGKDLQLIAEFEGSFRNETSILKPTILISGTIPINCNYFQIPDLNRYYFLTDIKSFRNNAFELSGRVDVLETYKNGIRNSQCIALKNETKSNMYINDDDLPSEQKSLIQLKTFPSGFNTQEFLLALTGN